MRIVGIEVEVEGDASGLVQVENGDNEHENWQNIFSFERVCKGLIEGIKNGNESIIIQK